MNKLLNFLILLVPVLGANASDGLGAELEGALQYPPPSVGEDAQPPPPARLPSQPVSPWRIELGVSGSNVPIGQRFYLLSPPRLDKPGGPPPSEAGG